jgi:hypothetical protein
MSHPAGCEKSVHNRDCKVRSFRLRSYICHREASCALGSNFAPARFDLLRALYLLGRIILPWQHQSVRTPDLVQSAERGRHDNQGVIA